MEIKNIKKSTLVKLPILGLFMLISYRLTPTVLRMVCKIKCTTCPGGIIDQDFTKEAISVEDRAESSILKIC